jgi:hypothetical protein
MSEAVAMDVASQRCQQARRAECLDALPDLVRSEGFFEDLFSESPPILRLRRSGDAAQPAWAGMLASALGLRRA